MRWGKRNRIKERRAVTLEQCGDAVERHAIVVEHSECNHVSHQPLLPLRRRADLLFRPIFSCR
jgi:hypothetical protein